MASMIGSKVERKEDKKFLTGKGRYTADINLHNQLHAVFIRSPHARAKIKAIDTSKAKKAAGVVDVLTGKDMQDDKIGGLIAGWKIVSKDGTDMKCPAHPPLATDSVNYVGDHIALVVAETLQEAKDAADLVKVDYKVLKAVASTAEAMNLDVIHEGIEKNLCFDWELGDKVKTDEAFASADKVVEMDILNNRLVPNAMEPRASIGDYNPSSEELTLYTTSQNPHLSRLVMSAFNAVHPEHKFRVVAPDVGGGFGSKIYPYSEDVIMAWAAKRLQRPVKWVCERTESFLSDCHGRDHITNCSVALNNDGTVTGLKVDTIANLGGYASLFATVTPTYLYGPLVLGLYNIPTAYCNVKAVYTNTAPVDAYRGAGRPEATYLIERIMDKAAKELGMDRAEFRKKNFIRQFPHQQCLVHNIDSGDYDAHFDKALNLADYSGFEKRKAESAAKGKLRGIGFSTYIEACGIAPSAAVMSLGAGVGLWESAEIRFNPTGNISLPEVKKIVDDPLIQSAVPVSFGDNYKNYRIVGTSKEFPNIYSAELKSGKIWSQNLEVTIGSSVAQKTKLKIGDKFYGSHGLGSDGHVHDNYDYVVVGIFEQSNSVLDNLILTDTQSVWMIHSNDILENQDKMITSMLVKFKSPIGLIQIPRKINRQTITGGTTIYS